MQIALVLNFKNIACILRKNVRLLQETLRPFCQRLWRDGGWRVTEVLPLSYSPTVDPGDGPLALHRLGHVWQQLQVRVPRRGCKHGEREGTRVEPGYPTPRGCEHKHSGHKRPRCQPNRIAAELCISGGRKREREREFAMLGATSEGFVLYPSLDAVRRGGSGCHIFQRGTIAWLSRRSNGPFSDTKALFTGGTQEQCLWLGGDRITFDRGGQGAGVKKKTLKMHPDSNRLQSDSTQHTWRWSRGCTPTRMNQKGESVEEEKKDVTENKEQEKSKGWNC